MGGDYGRVAYEAYTAAAGGRSLVSGDELPVWADLGSAVRDAWDTAATAVLQAAGET